MSMKCGTCFCGAGKDCSTILIRDIDLVHLAQNIVVMELNMAL